MEPPYNHSTVGEPSPKTLANWKQATTRKLEVGRHVIEWKVTGLPCKLWPVILVEYGVTLWRDRPGVFNHRRIWFLWGGLSILSLQQGRGSNEPQGSGTE